MISADRSFGIIGNRKLVDNIFVFFHFHLRLFILFSGFLYSFCLFCMYFSFFCFLNFGQNLT